MCAQSLQQITRFSNLSQNLLSAGNTVHIVSKSSYLNMNPNLKNLMDNNKNTKHIEPQMSPDEIIIFGSCVACEASMHQCEVGLTMYLLLNTIISQLLKIFSYSLTNEY